MSDEPEKILALEDCMVYVHGNFTELYPPIEGRSKTIANIPTGVHGQIVEIANERGLKMCEVLAGLLDFADEYEEIYADELKEQRARPKARR